MCGGARRRRFAHMTDQSAPDAFLSALAARDFERFAGSLAPSVQARLFLPRGPELRAGRDEIARRFEGWFASTSDFEVLESSNQQVGPRRRLTWRFRLSRDGQTRVIIEQVAFVDVGSEGIAQIDLLCSGFLALAEPVATT